MIVIAFVIVIVIILLLILQSTPSPPRLFGVYSQPGRYFKLKFHLIRWLIARRQRQKRKQPISDDSQQQQAAFDGGWTDSSSPIRRSIQQLERKQRLPSVVDAPMAVDAIFFNGSNADRNYMAMGVAQRQNDIYNTFLVFRLADIGILELVGMPETNTKATKTSVSIIHCI